MSGTQRYVFEGPDGWAWVEVWEGDGRVYVPSPFRSVEKAVEVITERNPGDVVDWLEVGTSDYREALAGCVAFCG